MVVKEIDINELLPNSYNSNYHEGDGLDAIIWSLKEFGFVSPIVINSKKEIIDGEHRWRAASILGYEKVPVVEVTDRYEKQRMLTYVLNVHGDNDKELVKGIINKIKNHIKNERKRV